MAGPTLPSPTTLPPGNHTSAVVLMASNASGYQEDHDLITTPGLTDKQRIVLAGVTAILLALCAIVIGFVLRRLMKKTSDEGVYTVEANFPLWRKRSDANSDDVCALNQQRAAPVSTTTTAANVKDPAAQLQSYGFDQQGGSWTTCSGAGMTSSNGMSVTSSNGGGGGGGGMTSSSSGNCVITMTMRNNHLIVETEESQCEVSDTPSLTTTSEPSTTTVCDIVDDQPVAVVHKDGAAPPSAERPRHPSICTAVVAGTSDRRPRHPSISTAVAGTGQSQAVDDLNGESDGCSPRHPYTYGGGQSEYGCQETTAPTRGPAPSRRPATHCKAYYKFQTQVSQDVGDTTRNDNDTQPATATAT